MIGTWFNDEPSGAAVAASRWGARGAVLSLWLLALEDFGLWDLTALEAWAEPLTVLAGAPKGTQIVVLSVGVMVALGVLAQALWLLLGRLRGPASSRTDGHREDTFVPNAIPFDSFFLLGVDFGLGCLGSMAVVAFGVSIAALAFIPCLVLQCDDLPVLDWLMLFIAGTTGLLAFVSFPLIGGGALKETDWGSESSAALVIGEFALVALVVVFGVPLSFTLLDSPLAWASFLGLGLCGQFVLVRFGFTFGGKYLSSRETGWFRGGLEGAAEAWEDSPERPIVWMGLGVAIASTMGSAFSIYEYWFGAFGTVLNTAVVLFWAFHILPVVAEAILLLSLHALDESPKAYGLVAGVCALGLVISARAVDPAEGPAKPASASLDQAESKPTQALEAPATPTAVAESLAEKPPPQSNDDVDSGGLPEPITLVPVLSGGSERPMAPLARGWPGWQPPRGIRAGSNWKKDGEVPDPASNLADGNSDTVWTSDPNWNRDPDQGLAEMTLSFVSAQPRPGATCTQLSFLNGRTDDPYWSFQNDSRVKSFELRVDGVLVAYLDGVDTLEVQTFPVELPAGLAVELRVRDIYMGGEWDAVALAEVWQTCD